MLSSFPRDAHLILSHWIYASIIIIKPVFIEMIYISNIMFFFFYHFLLRLSDNEIQIWCEMICIKFMWNHKFEVLFEMTYIKYSVKWYISGQDVTVKSIKRLRLRNPGASEWVERVGGRGFNMNSSFSWKAPLRIYAPFLLWRANTG